MKIPVHIVLTEVEPDRWAENSNGPWPEDDKRSLNTAVRQDIREFVQYILSQQAKFEELGIKVEVK